MRPTAATWLLALLFMATALGGCTARSTEQDGGAPSDQGQPDEAGAADAPLTEEAGPTPSPKVTPRPFPTRPNPTVTVTQSLSVPTGTPDFGLRDVKATTLDANRVRFEWTSYGKASIDNRLFVGYGCCMFPIPDVAAGPGHHSVIVGSMARGLSYKYQLDLEGDALQSEVIEGTTDPSDEWAPTEVTTVAVTNIDQSGADVTFQLVNAFGLDWVVHYGATTSYGSTGNPYCDEGQGDGEHCAAMSGNAPATKIHYRVEVGPGSVLAPYAASPDASFTTTGIPRPPQAGPAS